MDLRQVLDWEAVGSNILRNELRAHTTKGKMDTVSLPNKHQLEGAF